MSTLQKQKIYLAFFVALLLSFTLISFSKSTGSLNYVLKYNTKLKELPKLTRKKSPILEQLSTQTHVIQVVVNFKSIPTAASSSFAPLKYNKDVAVRLEFDDGGSSVYTNVFKKLNGGLATNGVNYPATTYTDGAGKTINFRAGAAVFSINSFDGRDVLDNYQGKVTWSQLKEMVAANWAIINHQYGGPDHSDRIQQVQDQNKYVYTKLKALGLEYRPRTLVVPGAEEGYTASAFELGMVLSSSEFGINQQDNFPFLPNDWSGKALVSAIPLKNTTLKRSNLGDDFLDAENFKRLLDQSLASSTATNKYHIAGFSHGPSGGAEVERFVDLMDYIKITGNDRVWVPNTQEFYEYLEVKNDVIKTETLSGNKLIITLDLLKVSEHNRFRDMSLLINSAAEIKNVTVTNADESTYNATTNLINIYKQKTTFIDPALDKIPPRIIALSVEDSSPNKVSITYDRPVTQNIHTAYQVTSNTVQAISGSGKNWQLTLLNNVDKTSDIKLSYRMQNGNATDSEDATSQVGSYINKAIRNNVGTANNPLPLAPNGLTASIKNDQNHVQLNWNDAATNETGFEIFKSEDNATYTLLTSLGANVTTYTDVSEKNSSDLKYKVKAINQAGSSDFSNEVSVKINFSSPNSPENLSGIYLNDNSSINLSWIDKANNETAYEIYRSKNESDYLLLKSTNANSSSFTDLNIDAGIQYKYKIRAKNTSLYSAFSNEFILSTPSASSKSDYRIYINFANNSTANGYWNNVAKPVNFVQFNNFKDAKLNVTPVGLKITSSWETWLNAAGNNGILNKSKYPIEVANTTWSTNKGPQTFKLTGLEKTMTYDLSFLAATKSKNANYTSIFTSNGKKVSINAANNTTNLVVLKDLIPSATGELHITLSNMVNGVAVMNALIIDAKSSPKDTTPTNPIPPSNPSAVKVKINFNGNSWNASSFGWNNTSASPMENYSISNLKDDTDRPTNLGLKLLDAWSSNRDYGFITGNNSGIYPDNVIRTFYSDNSGSPKRIKVQGLKTGYMYSFEFFASWKNPWSKAVTEYTVGDKTVSLDPANNQTKVVRIDYILGDANGDAIINIQKQAGSSYVFINSLIIEEFPLIDSAPVESSYSNTFINNSTQPFGIKIFPNPFTGNVYIDLKKLKNNELINIELLDLNGKVLKAQKLQSEIQNQIIDFNLNALYLSTGIYLIRISGNNTPAKIFKIQKQH